MLALIAISRVFASSEGETAGLLRQIFGSLLGHAVEKKHPCKKRDNADGEVAMDQVQGTSTIRWLVWSNIVADDGAPRPAKVHFQRREIGGGTFRSTANSTDPYRDVIVVSRNLADSRSTRCRAGWRSNPAAARCYGCERSRKFKEVFVIWVRAPPPPPPPPPPPRGGAHDFIRRAARRKSSRRSARIHRNYMNEFRYGGSLGGNDASDE